ncbi:MAG: hypothetical protein R6U44_10075 [Archaeoglobaceae archaeon]
MNKLKYFLSILLGLFAGPLFFVVAVFLNEVLMFRFDVWLPIGISLLMVSSIFVVIVKKEKASAIAVAVVLLILSSAFSLCFVYDSLLIGPGPEQLTYMHLLGVLRDEEGNVDPNWGNSDWEFYKPKCYSEFSVSRYGSTSLEVATFYYSSTSHNPIHFGLKHLFMKFFCGYTDSGTAYGKYKELLAGSGFQIRYGMNNFTAKNETTLIHCQLDGDFITVIHVDRDEKYLLSRTSILN